MRQLNLPVFDIKIREEGGKPYVFDVLRQKFVAITPEEWVRQHFVHFLTGSLSYPAGLMANEVELQAGDKRMRCDTVVYGRDMRPLMIIEYKKPDIPITERVFRQVMTYNWLLKVKYLVVSNGMTHVCCKIDYEAQKYEFLQKIPEFSQLTIDN